MKNTLQVVSATYINDYKLNITFNDGFVGIVDFSFFLNKSLNPSIRIFLDLKKFKSFQVKNGQLMWGDYELIFPVTNLRTVPADLG